MATIRDVAAMAEVSPATVSRVFTQPDLISETTRHRVLAVADQLKYRPPHLRTQPAATIARRPEAKQVTATGTIGFAVPEETPELSAAATSGVFYGPILTGVQAEAALLDLHVLLYSRELTPRVDGLLIVGRHDADSLGQLAQGQANVILVDTYDETGTYACVLSDGVAAGAMATRHLLHLGHRRIAFCGGDRRVTRYQDRLHGYVSALFDAGVLADPDRLIEGDSATDEERRRWLRQVLTQPDRPTALIAGHHDAAALALQVCEEAGLTVPGNISLVGFDDRSLRYPPNPNLTTVHTGKEIMGRLAVRLLHERLHQKRLQSEEAVSLPAIQHHVPIKLVVRHSCRSL